MGRCSLGVQVSKKKTHAFHESLIQTVPNSRAKGGKKKKKNQSCTSSKFSDF